MNRLRMRNSLPRRNKQTQTTLHKRSSKSFLRVLDLQNNTIIRLNARPYKKIWKVPRPRFYHLVRKRRTVDIHRRRSIVRSRDVMLNDGAEACTGAPVCAFVDEFLKSECFEARVGLALDLDAVHEIEGCAVTGRELDSYREN